MRRLLATALLVTSLVACGARTGPRQSDEAGTNPPPPPPPPGDFGPTPVPDMRPTPPPDSTPPSSGRDYVIDDLQLPRDQNQAAMLGFDYDGDGLPDNAFGGILAGLSGVLQGVDVYESTRLSVAAGDNILLVRVAANNFVNDSNVALTLWQGAPFPCCGDRTSYAACRSQGKSTCFSGNFPFKIASGGSLLRGAIASSSLAVSGSSLLMQMSLGGSAMQIRLRRPRVTARVGNLELTNGRITGGIPQSEISNSVIPAIAVLVDRLVNDPNTPQATRDQVLNLFDRNKDQRITAAEVRDNALIKTFLSGDVDVDGDGQLELTLGVGFNAIRAVIP